MTREDWSAAAPRGYRRPRRSTQPAGDVAPRTAARTSAPADGSGRSSTLTDESGRSPRATAPRKDTMTQNAQTGVTLTVGQVTQDLPVVPATEGNDGIVVS